MRLRHVLIAAAVILLAAGCEADKKDPKSVAAKEWEKARASVMLGLALDQYKTGSFDKCRETTDEALRLAPDSGALHLLSARLHIEKGLLEPAERELELARAYAPNDPEPQYLSGVVYQRWQKPETALQFYKSAADKAPAELAYLMAESETLVALDRSPEALALLSAKVTYFENSGVIRDAVGQLLMQAGRYDEAVAMLRQASILSPDDAAIRERYGLALYYHKDYRDCAEVLSALVQKESYSKRADLFTMLGECQLQIGKPRDARYSYETASQLDDSSAAVWRGLGQAALACGDLRRAELSLARSLKTDAVAAETHLLLGYVYLRQNRLPEALTQFQTSSAQDPRDTVSICMQGYVFEKMGRNQDATRCYGKALKIKPEDDMATRLMAAIDLHD